MGRPRKHKDPGRSKKPAQSFPDTRELSREDDPWFGYEDMKPSQAGGVTVGWNCRSDNRNPPTNQLSDAAREMCSQFGVDDPPNVSNTPPLLKLYYGDDPKMYRIREKPIHFPTLEENITEKPDSDEVACKLLKDWLDQSKAEKEQKREDDTKTAMQTVDKVTDEEERKHESDASLDMFQTQTVTPEVCKSQPVTGLCDKSIPDCTTDTLGSPPLAQTPNTSTEQLWTDEEDSFVVRATQDMFDYQTPKSTKRRSNSPIDSGFAAKRLANNSTPTRVARAGAVTPKFLKPNIQWKPKNSCASAGTGEIKSGAAGSVIDVPKSKNVANSSPPLTRPNTNPPMTDILGARFNDGCMSGADSATSYIKRMAGAPHSAASNCLNAKLSKVPSPPDADDAANLCAATDIDEDELSFHDTSISDEQLMASLAAPDSESCDGLTLLLGRPGAMLNRTPSPRSDKENNVVACKRGFTRAAPEDAENGFLNDDLPENKLLAFLENVENQAVMSTSDKPKVPTPTRAKPVTSVQTSPAMTGDTRPRPIPGPDSQTQERGAGTGTSQLVASRTSTPKNTKPYRFHKPTNGARLHAGNPPPVATATGRSAVSVAGGPHGRVCGANPESSVPRHTTATAAPTSLATTRSRTSNPPTSTSTCRQFGGKPAGVSAGMRQPNEANKITPVPVNGQITHRAPPPARPPIEVAPGHQRVGVHVTPRHLAAIPIQTCATVSHVPASGPRKPAPGVRGYQVTASAPNGLPSGVSTTAVNTPPSCVAGYPGLAPQRPSAAPGVPTAGTGHPVGEQRPVCKAAGPVAHTAQRPVPVHAVTNGSAAQRPYAGNPRGHAPRPAVTTTTRSPSAAGAVTGSSAAPVPHAGHVHVRPGGLPTSAGGVLYTSPCLAPNPKVVPKAASTVPAPYSVVNSTASAGVQPQLVTRPLQNHGQKNPAASGYKSRPGPVPLQTLSTSNTMAASRPQSVPGQSIARSAPPPQPWRPSSAPPRPVPVSQPSYTPHSGVVVRRSDPGAPVPADPGFGSQASGSQKSCTAEEIEKKRQAAVRKQQNRQKLSTRHKSSSNIQRP